MGSWGALATWGDLTTWGAWGESGPTWGDWDTWGDLTTWFDPSGTYEAPRVADLSPVTLAAPTITPLPRITATLRDLPSVHAHIGPGPGGASSTPSAITVAAESLAPSSQLVSIVSVLSTLSGVEVVLTPAASLPTVGIPIFVGATEPDYAGEALWIVTLDPLDIRYQEG